MTEKRSMNGILLFWGYILTIYYQLFLKTIYLTHESTFVWYTSYGLFLSYSNVIEPLSSTSFNYPFFDSEHADICQRLRIIYQIVL